MVEGDALTALVPDVPRLETSLAVVSDDVIFRRGVVAVSSVMGTPTVRAVSSSAQNVMAGRRGTGTYEVALVDLEATQGLDRFGGIEVTWALLEASVVQTVALVTRAAPTATVRLRATEAGCVALVPYATLAKTPDSVIAALARGDLPSQWRVPSQWAQRQQLGFSWSGNLRSLLKAAQALPDVVWSTDRAQDQLPISRSDVTALRQAAADAGVPEPDSKRYSGAHRKAPVLPEWARVRELVRELWGCLLP